jgi:hypothetical protein
MPRVYIGAPEEEKAGACDLSPGAQPTQCAILAAVSSTLHGDLVIRTVRGIVFL